MIKNEKVLVTGGAGFIGSNLCRILLDQGNKVICLDNFSTGYHSNITALLDNDFFQLIEGDIRNAEDCERAVEGCKYVFHHAALGSVPRSINAPGATTEVNVSGFVNMLHAAVQAGVARFIYAASSSTYGDHPALPKIEHLIGKPMSPYGVTKYANEVFAANFSELYGIETIGLRYFNVYGPNQSPVGAYAAVIPKFVIQLMNYESPVLNGDGSFSRDFTYIDNVILANLLAATTPSERIRERQALYYASLADRLHLDSDQQVTISEIFNVACGESTSLNDLLHLLKENLQNYDSAIADVKPTYGPGRIGDIPHSLAAIEKIKLLLDYKPVQHISGGLRAATEWYWHNYRSHELEN